MNLVDVIAAIAIVIFIIASGYCWWRFCLALLIQEWPSEQGPLTAWIREGLLKGDKTPYELKQWLKENAPGLPARNLWRGIASWEESGCITKYSKFDPTKGRDRVYLHWKETEDEH